MGAPDPQTHHVSTLDLLERAQRGDARALNALLARYLPLLRRWASGRLPRWARDMADTPDLVQETLVRTFKNIDRFEYRGEGAFQAYLRQAVMNGIRTELRKARHRAPRVDLDPEMADTARSPLEAAIGAEAVDRYEAALGRLEAAERELVVARLELGLTYPEIASATAKPSANAARMAVARALLRLAELMHAEERIHGRGYTD